MVEHKPLPYKQGEKVSPIVNQMQAKRETETERQRQRERESERER